MPKIKDIIERLMKNPAEYTEIRLLVAKRTLAFFLAFYFVSLLFTIGGFTFFGLPLSFLAAITFHAYSILVIVLAWFFYEVTVYASEVYLNSKKWPILAMMIFSVFFVLIALFAHLFRP